MGRVITECVEKRDNCEIVAGVDKVVVEAPFPVVDDISKVNDDADVIIDFSPEFW